LDLVIGARILRVWAELGWW